MVTTNINSITSDQSISKPCFVHNPLSLWAKFLPQTGDMHIHRALTHQRIVRPHGREDFLPREETPRLLPEEVEDNDIFTAVKETARRTVNEIVNKTKLFVAFHEVRGLKGVKEATIRINDMDVNVAVAHGTANAAKLLDSIRSGEKTYHFIEVMACPGGCVTGGGQPIVSAQKRMECDPKALRAAALYNEDANKPQRKSHENASIMAVYKDYLGEPNSHLAHELLHTHYTARPKYKK